MQHVKPELMELGLETMCALTMNVGQEPKTASMFY